MKSSCLAVLALAACAAGAHAQTNHVYRLAAPTVSTKHGVAVIDASTLLEAGSADSATRVFGYPGKRMGLESVGDGRPFNLNGLDRDALNNRAWGISVGLQAGPVNFRIAHQNRNVAKVAPAMPLGNRMDAKNSTVGASIELGAVKAYTAYSANRGWGSSPLWNPDNPYGAAMASIPSTDSRDVLVGLALPLGRTTLLASVIRKNDRDLANRDADQFAFGGTYAISRHTDVYSAYSLIRPRSGPGYMVGTPVAPMSGSSAINLGMRHSF
jgi:predicted porin